MGYNTIFTGELKFTKPIIGPDIAFLKSILGEDCRDHPEWLNAYLEIPEYDTESKYGGLTYMDLVLTDDFNGLRWNDETEKTYDLVDKVNLIVTLMRRRVPGFGLVGVLNAQGEGWDDRWRLVVKKTTWARRETLVVKGIPHTCPSCGEKFIEEEDE